jgi:lipopolysaccharide transport system permease protein
MAMINRKWDWEISSKTTFWRHGLSELWAYRDLVTGLIRRQFLLNYQQTVLGPFWVLFQPLITLLTYLLVFTKMVGISTGPVPPVLFYFSGIILWNFFHDSFTNISATLRENVELFSKVYFPRILVPISVLGTQLLRFSIQLVLFLGLVAYFSLVEGLSVPFSGWLLAFPLSILLLAGLSLGMGLIFAVVTAKYRDLTNLLGVGVRLLMFLTPVIYSLEVVPPGMRWLVFLNPLTSVFELFRLSLLGHGHISLFTFLYSLLCALLLSLFAMLLFHKKGDKLIEII